MQRDGEAELHRFVGKFFDLRHETDGGHGDFSRTDAKTPRGVDDPQCTHQVVVICQRFAHAHNDDVVNLFAAEFLDLQDLIHDLGRGEVAFDAVETARTELAAVGATDLRGNADGVAGATAGQTRGG